YAIRDVKDSTIVTLDDVNSFFPKALLFTFDKGNISVAFKATQNKQGVITVKEWTAFLKKFYILQSSDLSMVNLLKEQFESKLNFLNNKIQSTHKTIDKNYIRSIPENEITALITEINSKVSLLNYEFEKINLLNDEIKKILINHGNFNASGSYLNKNKQKTLDNILYNNNLIWGIDHSGDTTVATKCNAYDRFIFEIKNKER
ncbi:45347_t:CDS:2, partial [Gigaspora margarita]